MATVDGLGYRSERVPDAEGDSSAQEPEGEEIPEPIATALVSARSGSGFLLLDFHAPWCVACKTLDSKVLVSPQVEEALSRIDFLKVDADEHVEAARHYAVMSLPTLLMLSPDGTVLFRTVGLVGADEVVSEIDRVLDRD